MYKRKRLHPIAIGIKTMKYIKDLLFPFIAVLFLGQKGTGAIWISIIFSTGVLTILIITSVLSWYRYTYQLTEKELQIEYGIFVRKKRYIPFERIQSLDRTEGVLQRLFGLVKVQIETAGGDPLEGAEAVLSAISKQESQAIEEFFAKAKNGQLPAEASANRQSSIPIYKITTGQLLLLSLTSGGAGVAISAVFAFLSQFDQLIPYKRLYGDVERLVASGIMAVAVMVFIVLLLIWIVALIGMMLKYANFTVHKTEDDLIISQGLLSRRQITIPLKRIQAVRISENIVRQLLGFATVYLESAGGSNENKEGSRVMLLPLVRLEQVPAMINDVLTDYSMISTLKPAPKRAMIRYMIRSCFVSIPIVAIAVIFLKAWGFLSLILFGVMTFWAFLMYKDAGWNLENQQLTLRYRTVNRHTIFMKKNKIQCLEVKEGFLQKKKELATIETFLKSGIGSTGGKVTDLDRRDIEKVYSWYAAKKVRMPGADIRQVSKYK